MKYYPEVIMIGVEDVPTEEELAKCDDSIEYSNDKLTDMFIRKFSILKGFKSVKESDIINSNNTKTMMDDDNSELGKRKVETGEMDQLNDTVDCKLMKRKELFSEGILKNTVLTGVFMRDDMYEYLCKCDDCLEMYIKLDPLLSLFSDKYYEDKNFEEAVAETEANPIDDSNDKDEGSDAEFMKYMAIKFKERTGRDISTQEQMVMSQHYSHMKEQLGNIILRSGKTEITEQDIKNFLDMLQSR